MITLDELLARYDSATGVRLERWMSTNAPMASR